MSVVFRKSAVWAFGAISSIFTFVPETVFAMVQWVSESAIEECKWAEDVTANDINIVISRILTLIAVWIFTVIMYSIYLRFRKTVTIKGNNYTIRVEYGDLLKASSCKKVISFDECFTTKVGEAPEDIKPSSICGQYLIANPTLDIQKLIEDAGLSPAEIKSKYQGKDRYESGSIVPNGDDLLLAFARLDESGCGRFFSRDEYLECLSRLWIELDKYYAGKDVCISILGAGITRFDGASSASISQQELLDMMIWSYKLNSHKIKAPYKLRIICKRSETLSLNKIDSNV